MKIHCETLNYQVELPDRIERIVSLVAGFTETIFELGCGDKVVGVSSYCPRYVKNLNVEIVGDYLNVDETKLSFLKPDVVLLTTGVQRELARKLHRKNYPVFVLPLPKSINGVWENVLTLGGLLKEVKKAKDLVLKWQKAFVCDASLKREKLSVYVELWLGKHVRTIGGLSFVNDLVEYAGLKNIFGDVAESFFIPDFEKVRSMKPEILVFFYEPDFPIEPQKLIERRGWNWPFKLIESTVEPEKNLIHDGPSMMRTIQWLRQKIWG
ncbi:helical backbone metal receptor [Pseudothermotoga sp.]|nr:helical backbone metal receptor [Pseudothermotoga sp.]MCX7812529.1 helical backbone metal receptor [Pseudothermotoga sp.]MDW8138810.1 helical backbone metal receptor [Pseudothermotoga sp.]